MGCACAVFDEFCFIDQKTIKALVLKNNSNILKQHTFNWKDLYRIKERILQLCCWCPKKQYLGILSELGLVWLLNCASSRE